MDEQNNTQEKARRGFSKTKILLINGLAMVVAIICFVVIAIWLPLKGPFFDAPLRSFLTGLGLLGLAFPPFTLGFIFQKKAALSPYFEEGFIRTGFYIVGFVCLIMGLICIGLSVYALIMRMFEEEKQPLIFTASLTALNLNGYLGTILKATSFPI
jgi:ABC-type dipeptide/oligopeptide/nickel transport system permease component